MKMDTSNRIRLLYIIVAALVLIDVAAPSVQGTVAAVYSDGEAWQGQCEENCPDPAGGERPCGRECICYFCYSSGVGTWMLSSTSELPAPHSSMTRTASNDTFDPRDVSIGIYHPPKF
jgi:hypothetical protein